MIPVGQPYRPAGGLDLRSILVTLILGTVVAILSAALIWLWEISPIPTLVIITPVIQGIIVGAAMAFMVGRLRMRNPWLVGTIGFACGLLSIGLVHFGHHLMIVSQLEAAFRTQIAEERRLPEDQRRQMLADFEADPTRIVDATLVDRTGHAGLVGTMILRNEQGVRLKNTEVSGWFLWLLWAGEALFVAVTAAAMASSRASEPFCEECGCWCAKQPDVFTLPAAATESLVAAVRDDQPSLVAAVKAQPLDDDGSGRVGVTLHSCPQCDESFADVSHRVQKGKEMKVTTLLKGMRVSPEMAEALRTPPLPPQSDEPQPVAGAEQPIGGVEG